MPWTSVGLGVGTAATAAGQWELGVASPSWARVDRGLASQPRWAASLARAPAARAQGAAAMAAVATLHLLLYGEDEDSPKGLSSFRPGLPFFKKNSFFF